MSSNATLRKKVRNQLENVKAEHGDQALLRLFKFMVPKSWSQSQILNCLVEFGLDELNYTISGGTRSGEIVDFFSVYPNEWMRIASCDVKPRYDLKALFEMGFIKKMKSHRLKFRKSASFTMDWYRISKSIKEAESMMEKYLNTDPEATQ